MGFDGFRVSPNQGGTTSWLLLFCPDGILHIISNLVGLEQKSIGELFPSLENVAMFELAQGLRVSPQSSSQTRVRPTTTSE